MTAHDGQAEFFKRVGQTKSWKTVVLAEAWQKSRGSAKVKRNLVK